MARNWTPQQKNAIEARDGTLLVSAAAGSGKTAVLVERVIERICDKTHPCDADRMLIVTFTKAAAAEMKERIGAAIAARLRDNPGDTHLLRQQLLLPQAGICTIDSFCNDLVRENFHRLGIAPDYQILDSGELTLLREEACSAALESMYSENDPSFVALAELLSVGRDDRALSDAVMRLYDYTRAYPFPEEWLARMAGAYESGLSLEDGAWGETIFCYLSDAVSYCLAQLRQAVALLAEEESLRAAYAPALLDGCAQLETIRGMLEEKDWDRLGGQIRLFAFPAFGRAPRAYSGHPVKDAVTGRRDMVKKLVPKLCDLLCATRAEHREDMEALRPLVEQLAEAVRRYGERFAGKKLERRAVDFSDVEHMALSLMITGKDGEIERTPLAEELARRYEEILVDEYQDTNEAQDLLFQAISRSGDNLFLVGDVKQSIYRFRQAMPEIFLHRRDALAPYTHGNYPARINLDRNFRSRAGVTGMVNFLFRQLMSRELGELDYDEQEALVASASYPETGAPDAEIHLLNTEDREEEEAGDLFEASYIARMIRDMVASGMTVLDGGVQRPARYRDFCILLRATTSHAQGYTQALRLFGIPGWSDLSGGFFAAPEVQQVLSMLRVLDNPVQDIPLLSVLLSPVYGFTPEELADLRLPARKSPLYSAVVQAAQSGSAKCAGFLRQIEFIRRLSAALPAHELIRRLYDETDFPELVQAMPGGVQRMKNLRLLLEYAAKYEAAGYRGLSGFIRFIDRLEEQEADLAPAAALSEAADVVRVMSIHKSKGLEFPVCIVARCAGAFSTSSRRGNMLLHPRLGVGFMRRDMETLRQFPTLPYRAVQLATEQAELSEELRVLYVALTRAKERLITVMSVRSPEKKLAALAAELGESERIAPFAVRNAKSYADWLLMAALRHPDAQALRALSGTGVPVLRHAGFALRVVLAQRDAGEEMQGQTQTYVPAQPDSALCEEIGRRCAYRYPYALLCGVAAKRAASELAQQGIDYSFVAKSRPAFLNREGLTPAQRGTAMHLFMQYADYPAAASSPEAECERLASRGFLSTQEAQAVDCGKIRRFFASPLAARIFAAPEVLREYKFTFFVAAEETDASLPQSLYGEKVLVQGIADCAFVEDGQLVIVDYKTDHVKDGAALVRRYAPQLSVYRRALSECTGYPVKETLLYSFALGRAIPVSSADLDAITRDSEKN